VIYDANSAQTVLMYVSSTATIYFLFMQIFR